jgi:hypothetical protein
MNKPNLNKIIEANKDKTSHVPGKVKHGLPKQNSFINDFKMGGGYFPPYHSFTPPRMNNGGGLLSKKVTCSSCGWSWKSVEGGKDPITCHRCGGMIRMQYGGLTKYQTKGEVINTDNKPYLPYRIDYTDPKTGNHASKWYEDEEASRYFFDNTASELVGVQGVQGYYEKPPGKKRPPSPTEQQRLKDEAELKGTTKSFYNQWYNSPMHAEMLKESLRKPFGTGLFLNKRVKQKTQDRLNSINNEMDLNLQPLPQDGIFDMSSAGHVNTGNPNLIQISPFSLLEDQKGTSIHEGAHVTDLLTGIPRKDTKKMQRYADYNKAFNSGNEYFTEDPNSQEFKQYVGKDTEGRGRVMEGKYILSQIGSQFGYDPFTQKLSKDQFYKAEELSPDFKRINNELRSIYSDEQILDLHNTLSKSNNNQPQTMARYGGIGDISSYYNINKRNKKQGGEMITDPMGQWKYPGMNTRIPGSKITMQGVPYPVLAKANNGMSTMMYPGQDYNFPGARYVNEYPMMRHGSGMFHYGPGGQTTDGCPAGYNKHPLTGQCIPNGWVASSSTQAGPTVAAAAEMNKNIGLNAVRQFANQQRPNATYNYVTPNQGQQATVGRSSSDEPWRKRQVAEIKREQAMGNSQFSQTMGSFTPQQYADYTAPGGVGSIGANTMANMLPGTGQFLSGARLYDFARVPNNNQYFSKDNGIIGNTFGALGLLGDVSNFRMGFKMRPQNVGNVAEDITSITGVPRRNDISILGSKVNNSPFAKPIATQAGVLAMTEEELAQAMAEIENANIPQENLEFNYNPTEEQIQERIRLKNLFNKIENDAAPEITEQQYREKLRTDKLRKDAGDILRTQGQPDPSIGGWSPTNNPQTNRMVGLAQYGKPQKLTNLDFVTNEQLVNEKIFTSEFDKQIKWFMDMGYDTEAAVEKATNRTLEILKDHPDFDHQLGIERTLQRLTRGPNTYNRFSKQFRPEFLQSQKPLSNQAKSVMRANPSGAMDANFSISDPNIKVFGDRMPGFNNQNNINLSSIKYYEDLLKLAEDPADILKIKEKLGKLYQNVTNTIPEGTPYTGTKAFNTLTPNKFGGSIERFKLGGLKGSPNNFRNEPCPEGQVRVNGQCMPVADAEAFRQRQYQQNPNTSWEEINPGEYRTVGQMTPVTVTSKPKYGTVTQNLGNGISFDYTANLKNQTPVSKTWDFTLPAKGQLNAQNAKWKSYLPSIYNQPLYTPFGNTTNINGMNIPIGQQATIGPDKSASQFLTPEAKERLKYLEAWYGKPKMKSDWEIGLDAYDKQTDYMDKTGQFDDIRQEIFNNTIGDPYSVRNQARDITTFAGNAGQIASLPLIGGIPAVSRALTTPLLGRFATRYGTGALTAGNALNLYFADKGIRSAPETYNSWGNVINDPNWNNFKTAAGNTVETGLDLLPIMHSAYNFNPNTSSLKYFFENRVPDAKLNGIDFSKMKFNPKKGIKNIWNKLSADSAPFAETVLDKIHDGIPLTNEEIFFYEKSIKNDPGIESQWRADRLSSNRPTEAFLEMPKNPDGTYYKGPTTTPQSNPTISKKNRGIFTNEATTMGADGKTYVVDKDNPSKVVVVDGEDFYFVDETDPAYSIIQETFNPSYKKPATTQPQTTAAVAEETKPVTTQESTPAAVVEEKPTTQTTSTQTSKRPEDLTLQERLDRARTESDPNPGPTPTEKNTGTKTTTTETPTTTTPTNTTKKPVVPPGLGKKILKGAGIFGGFGLGMYGLSRLANSNVPPTKPFRNAPDSIKNVNKSDTMFYGPTLDSSYLDALDTSYVNPLDTSYVNPDTGQVAPLTPEEIRIALDTAGVPRRRFGGQQDMRRFQNGGMISIEGLQKALNNIKI